MSAQGQPQLSARRLTKHPPPQQLPPPAESHKELKMNTLGKRNPGTSSTHPARPEVGRSSSFMKRHASFDSPREIALPPSPSTSRDPFSYFPNTMGKAEPNTLTKSRPNSVNKQGLGDVFTPTFDDNADDGWTNVSREPSQPSNSQRPSHSPLAATQQLLQLPTGAPILPNSRPYSLPHGGSYQNAEIISPGKSGSSGSIDRTSSASLPLPYHTPYHALPKLGVRRGSDDRLLPSGKVGDVARSTTAEAEEDGHDAQRPPMPPRDSDGSVRSDVSSLQSCSSVETPPPEQLPQSSSPPPMTRPASESAAQSNRNYPHRRDPPEPLAKSSSLPPAPLESQRSQQQSEPYPAFSSPYKSDIQSFKAPAPPVYDSLSPPSSYATAMPLRRPMSANSSNTSSSGGHSFFPPPEPPTILPPPEPPGSHHVFANSTANAPQPLNSSSRSNSTAPSSLAVPGTLSSSSSTSSSGGSEPISHQHQQYNALRGGVTPTQPPYVPFLSTAPPPADSWIEVETTPTEYRLNVRLPGFKRDGITLATKRRRILHVVADSWADGSNANGSGGGHFERRISFGYDADLVQVRAEFDGEMLRVVVPRRVPPVMGMGVGWV